MDLGDTPRQRPVQWSPPFPVLSVQVGRNCGGLLTCGPGNGQRERRQVRGPCREGGKSQEMMGIPHNLSTLPPSSPGTAPLSPKESGLASFPNSWTGPLVFVTHPTLHHTQAPLLLYLKVGLGEALLNLLGKPPSPSFFWGQTLSLHFFGVKPAPFSSQTTTLPGKPHPLFLL